MLPSPSAWGSRALSLPCASFHALRALARGMPRALLLAFRLACVFFQACGQLQPPYFHVSSLLFSIFWPRPTASAAQPSFAGSWIAPPGGDRQLHLLRLNQYFAVRRNPVSKRRNYSFFLRKKENNNPFLSRSRYTHTSTKKIFNSRAAAVPVGENYARPNCSGKCSIRVPVLQVRDIST